MSDYNEEEQNPDASTSADSPPAEGGQRPAGNMSTDTRYIRSLEGIVKLVSVVSYTYIRYHFSSILRLYVIYGSL